MDIAYLIRNILLPYATSGNFTRHVHEWLEGEFMHVRITSLLKSVLGRGGITVQSLFTAFATRVEKDTFLVYGPKVHSLCRFTQLLFLELFPKRVVEGR